MASFNLFGKPVETVDIGQEMDYANYEWFKDPPPPPQMVRTTLYPGSQGQLTRQLSRYLDQPRRS
jgi:hypothetical protein